MAVVARSVLKAYFETGDVMTAQSFVDLVDSYVNLAGTTAQTMNSDLVLPNLIATNVSAGAMTITGRLEASAATYTGAARHGVSAAASAANSLGYFLVTQESTVGAATTAQVAFLPSTSNIERLFVKVIVGGSAGAGGLRINVGTADARNYFGTISVSAVGLHEFVLVSAVRLTGVSGRVEMVASAASANTNIIGGVQYYQRA